MSVYVRVCVYVFNACYVSEGVYGVSSRSKVNEIVTIYLLSSELMCHSRNT